MFQQAYLARFFVQFKLLVVALRLTQSV